MTSEFITFVHTKLMRSLWSQWSYEKKVKNTKNCKDDKYTFFLYTVFPLGVLYPEHSQLAFDCDIIACSLESIRPGLVQGCKAPNGVG